MTRSVGGESPNFLMSIHLDDRSQWAQHIDILFTAPTLRAMYASPAQLLVGNELRAQRLLSACLPATL